MLFPMLLPRGHLVAMATVAALIFSERLEQPSPSCWLPIFSTATDESFIRGFHQ